MWFEYLNSFFSLVCFVGLDKIEYLQQHDNEDIYRKAYEIIQVYFRDEEEDGEDIDIAPDSTTDHYAFGNPVQAPENGFAL